MLNYREKRRILIKRNIRFSRVAAFLAIILITMLLSRIEEQRQMATAAAPATESVPVLMYHHLLRRAENTRYQGNEIVTYVEDFTAQLDWLAEQGYQTISPAQLVDWYENGTPLPQKPVMITFDDGYLSNFVYAYPLLKARGFSAVIFSVTGKIADAPVTFRADQINMADRQTMQAGGDVFFYASHTHDLHHLTGKHSALVTVDSATAAADLQTSLQTVSAFPSGTTAIFSYPYGNYSDAVETLLAKHGVRLAFRASSGKLTRATPRYALPRYPVSFAVSLKTFQSYFQN